MNGRSTDLPHERPWPACRCGGGVSAPPRPHQGSFLPIGGLGFWRVPCIPLRQRNVSRDPSLSPDSVPNLEALATPQEAVDRLILLHDAAVQAQRDALERFFATGAAPTGY